MRGTVNIPVRFHMHSSAALVNAQACLCNTTSKEAPEHVRENTPVTRKSQRKPIFPIIAEHVDAGARTLRGSSRHIVALATSDTTSRAAALIL